MRLLTHNMLQCHVKECKKDNFPLKIELGAPVTTQPCEFNRDFILNMLLKIDYMALLQALEDLKMRSDLQMPDQLPEDLIAKADSQIELIKRLHKALMEVIPICTNNVQSYCQRARVE
jgi:multifunctional methyltransferase subunit TRM112